jgi:hypothetical protein
MRSFFIARHPSPAIPKLQRDYCRAPANRTGWKIYFKSLYCLGLAGDEFERPAFELQIAVVLARRWWFSTTTNRTT